MKKTFSILFLLVTYIIFAQEKWVTTTGFVSFEASVPFFEEVKAQNNTANCILNTKENTIVSDIIISEFNFKRDLMKIHFNDNYMESDTYPKATFKGIIDNFDFKNIDSKEKEIVIKGKITVHGTSKNITIKALIRKEVDAIYFQSHFVLNTDDFDITIPTIILPKISKFVKIKIAFVLKN